MFAGISIIIAGTVEIAASTLVAVGVGVATVGAVVGSVVASSEAQKAVAEKNAQATIKAAQFAMEGQVKSSEATAKADMFRSTKEKERDQLYFQYQRQADNQRWQQEQQLQVLKSNVQSAVLYAETLPQGGSIDGAYDHGNGQTVNLGSGKIS